MANFIIYVDRAGDSIIEIIPYGDEDLVAGDIVYFDIDGLYHKATASIISKSNSELKMLLQDATVGTILDLLSFGVFTFDTEVLIPGGKYNLSVTPGEITSSIYTDTANNIRYIGTAISTKELIFNPDQTYISGDRTKVNGITIGNDNTFIEHTHIEIDISDLDRYTTSEVDELIFNTNWKLHVDSVSKGDILNNEIVDFIGGTGITLSYNATNNAITINRDAILTGWLLIGNSGTVDGTNFIGTTDNIPLTFRVNNIQAGRIDHIKQNYSFGFEALLNNSSGGDNVAIGHESLKFNTTGFSNTAVGHLSLNLNTIGYDNTSIGNWTMPYNLTGLQNTAIGGVALNDNRTGDSNTALGQYALNNSMTGNYNTGIGRSALNTLKGTNKPIDSFSDYSGTIAGTIKATSIAHGRSTSDSIIISPTNPWGTGYKGTHIITVIDVDNFYFTDTWTTTGTAYWTLTGELPVDNVALGMNAGSGITFGSGNTILGAGNFNLDNGLTNNILLISGKVIRSQYDGNKWRLNEYGQGTITGIPTYNLQVDNTGNIIEGVSTGYSAPSSAIDSGIQGETRYTSTYIYTCIATNTWVRSVAATW